MFRKMDDFIIDKVFQRVADALAGRVTPGIMAQNSLILCSLFEIFRSWKTWQLNEFHAFSAIMAGFFITFLLAMAFMADGGRRAGLMPKERLTLFPVRVFLLIVFVFIIIAKILPHDHEILRTIDIFVISTELAGLYFLACRTNPPRTKEVFSGKFVQVINR